MRSGPDSTTTALAVPASPLPRPVPLTRAQPVIAAPGIAPPRPVPAAADAARAAVAPALIAANNPRLRIDAPPFAARPAASGAGNGGLLVPIPLAAFGWPGPTARPRSRGDHVLIWREPGADGAADLRLPGGGRPLMPGCAEWLPAGTAFAITATGAEGVALLVPRLFAARTPAPLPAAPLGGRPDAEGRSRLAAAMAALARGPATGPAAEAAALCHLGLIAVTLADLGTAAPSALSGPAPLSPVTASLAAPADAAMREASRALVARFSDLAGNELDRGRTLGELAAALGTTSAILDRACRQSRSQGAMDLIYELRRARAVHLLREGRMTPARIAAATGFASLAHMSRIISAATGRAATQFIGQPV